jgi:hypothetical protein
MVSSVYKTACPASTLLVDKDTKPNCHPGTFADVSGEEVHACFALLGEEDLSLPLPS